MPDAAGRCSIRNKKSGDTSAAFSASFIRSSYGSPRSAARSYIVRKRPTSAAVTGRRNARGRNVASACRAAFRPSSGASPGSLPSSR
jgi:hypothetical protein